MMAKLWMLLFLVSVVAVVSQVKAETTTQSEPETTTASVPEQPDLDNDDDKDDDDDDERCKKYDKKDGHKDDDDDDDDKHHRRRCGKRRIAKLLCFIGIIVAVLVTAFGVTVCFVRYRRKRARQIAESQSTLQCNPEKSKVYIVTDPGYNQQNTPSAPGWPVVSAEPLPGKE